MVVRQSEFARMCGVTPASIGQSVKKGILTKNEMGWINTLVPKNKEYLRKRQMKMFRKKNSTAAASLAESVLGSPIYSCEGQTVVSACKSIIRYVEKNERVRAEDGCVSKFPEVSLPAIIQKAETSIDTDKFYEICIRFTPGNNKAFVFSRQLYKCYLNFNNYKQDSSEVPTQRNFIFYLKKNHPELGGKNYCQRRPTSDSSPEWGFKFMSFTEKGLEYLNKAERGKQKVSSKKKMYTDSSFLTQNIIKRANHPITVNLTQQEYLFIKNSLPDVSLSRLLRQLLLELVKYTDF